MAALIAVAGIISPAFGFTGMEVFAAGNISDENLSTGSSDSKASDSKDSDSKASDLEDADTKSSDLEDSDMGDAGSDTPEDDAYLNDPQNPAMSEISNKAKTDDPVRADITSADTDVQAKISDATQTDDDNVVIKEDDKPYLALGADLTSAQKSQVLELMGINPADIGSYNLVTVKNEEEHQYLDAYLDAKTIGTRALSSVVIVKRDAGDGIHISTKNISYCTIGMYKNALATAGLEDADVIVAAPFPISGTAALIGAVKAYADMEDTKVDKESLDAAMNEIVVTGELSENLGDKEQSEQLIAYVKKKVLEDGLDSAKEIQGAVSEACDKFQVSLSDENKERIVSLMEKIGSLDIDVDSLLEQAGAIYDSIADMEDKTGFFAGIVAFFKKIADAIVSFIQGIFS